MSYHLRIILPSAEGVPATQIIGDMYHPINRDLHPNQFEPWRALISNEEKCYGVVVYNHGKAFRALYRGQEAYIMNNDGGTFENLTHIDDKAK